MTVTDRHSQRSADMAVIDLSGIDDPAEFDRVAAELDAINRDLGFFCVTGHGVDRDLIARMYDVTARFFHLPAEHKQRSRLDRDSGMRGWEPAGERALGRGIGDDTPPDLREVFGSSRPVEDLDDAYYREVEGREYFFAGTNWPDEPAEMRTVWGEYYAAMERLADTIYRLMERALELPAGWFAPFNDRHASPMIANFYPPVSDPLPGQLRAGAHTDYGGFTIVYQDDAPGGLQVSDQRGGWIDIAPRADTFAVNLGDLMARWTNDRWVSTLHRVVLPPAAIGGDGASPWRISFPFFQQPNADAVIRCIPGCEGPTGPKYGPVTSGRNWYNKNIQTMGGTPLPEWDGD